MKDDRDVELEPIQDGEAQDFGSAETWISRSAEVDKILDEDVSAFHQTLEDSEKTNEIIVGFQPD